HLELTPEGARRATEVMRKHRLAERLLTDVIKLDWPYVHEEACRWEHVMSERVEQQLLELLAHPHHDPYGNPIPGLGDTQEAGAGTHRAETTLAEAASGQPLTFTLVRIGEALQVDIELLTEFERVGLVPGSELLARSEATVELTVGEHRLELPADVAGHLFVRPAPAPAAPRVTCRPAATAPAAGPGAPSANLNHFSGGANHITKVNVTGM